MEETPRLPCRRLAVEPGLFPRRSASAAEQRHARSRRPSRGTRSTRWRPRRRGAAEAERRRRLIAIARRPRRTASRAELVLAADQFIIKPAGRVEEAARAQRRRRRSAHRHRRLSLVHRLGPRHDDQPRGADAVDRPLPRGRLHPAHVRALHARRPDPEHVSRRRSAKGCTTPPTRRCGSSTRSTATRASTGDDETLRTLLPMLDRHHRSITCAARTSASASIRRDGLLAQGAEGYQLTWMDAKVDDWVVTPRRGKAVEINALWYNALRLLRALDARARRRRRARLGRRTRERARESFNERFWYERRRLSVRRRRRRAAATIRRCRPNQMFAISLPTPGARPRRAGQPVMEVVRERLLTPVGLRSLAPGDPDYKARTTAICARATPRITRARCGRG